MTGKASPIASQVVQPRGSWVPGPRCACNPDPLVGCQYKPDPLRQDGLSTLCGQLAEYRKTGLLAGLPNGGVCGTVPGVACYAGGHHVACPRYKPAAKRPIMEQALSSVERAQVARNHARLMERDPLG